MPQDFWLQTENLLTWCVEIYFNIFMTYGSQLTFCCVLRSDGRAQLKISWHDGRKINGNKSKQIIAQFSRQSVVQILGLESPNVCGNLAVVLCCVLKILAKNDQNDYKITHFFWVGRRMTKIPKCQLVWHVYVGSIITWMSILGKKSSCVVTSQLHIDFHKAVASPWALWDHLGPRYLSGERCNHLY
jgi:hypothetical protein